MVNQGRNIFNKSKKLKKRSLIAGVITLLICLAEISNVLCSPINFDIRSFTTNKFQADIGENILFQWEAMQNHSAGIILFGDGSSAQFTGQTTYILKNYSAEGEYTVILTLWNALGVSDTKVLDQKITITNEPPQFDIIFPSSAYEDEDITISTLNLQESFPDRQEGMLNYLFDFGDSQQVATNQSSITHKWMNAGRYPITITVFDDQIALTQQTEFILIQNRPPETSFIVNAEIPAGLSIEYTYYGTYDWNNELLYSNPQGWSIKEEDRGEFFIQWSNSEHDYILFLSDSSHTDSVQAEDTFQDQTHGTVEAWIFHYNYDKSWAFTYLDTSEVAFSLTINNDRWQYSLDGMNFVDIEGLPNPNIYSWHHLRVDFCMDNSNYGGLGKYQFKVYIDDIPSRKYYLNELNSINKMFIETGIEESGLARIDAIGYSWDPNYNVGYNKELMETYPKKSNIHFSAQNFIDSYSDLSTLRFYWDFGDNITAFGKNVTHSYLSTGVYNVSLCIMDDDRMKAYHSQIINFHNLRPDLNLDIKNNREYLYEGETLILEAPCLDDTTDLAQLRYFYDLNETGFNLNDTSKYEKGGWRKTQIYKDDYEGQIGVIVIDPENKYDYSYSNITVKNVPPKLSVWDANVVVNVSTEIIRNNTNEVANFSIEFNAWNYSYLTFLQNFSYDQNTSISSEEIPFTMPISKDWKIHINTTSEIPENISFQVKITLEFLNGEVLIITSEDFHAGNYANTSIDLNLYWFNQEDYSFKYPLTFNASIFDPSVDDITYIIKYQYEKIIQLNCSNFYSDTRIFEGDHPNSLFIVNTYSQNGEKFAKIEYDNLVSFGFFNNNSFPVVKEFQFTLLSDISLNEILTGFGYSNLEIITSNKAQNFIKTIVEDDDGGKSILAFEFNTTSNIVFSNLAPRVLPEIPKIGVLDNETIMYGGFAVPSNLMLIGTETFSHEFGINSMYNDFQEDMYTSEFYSIYSGNLTLEYAGEYLMNMKAQNNFASTISGANMKIPYPNFYGKIGSFSNITTQDTLVHFRSDFFASGCKESDLMFMWSFGDGTFAYTKNPSHAWSAPGVYNITFLTVDPYGRSYLDSQTLLVQEEPPEILGPFTFYGVEGQAVVLDVEIYDALLDELMLKYYWYDSNGVLISTDKKPIVILDNGAYYYTLVVTDARGQSTEAKISVIIENIAPQVFVSNYMYSGAPGGILTLNAYGFDTFLDTDNLTYIWSFLNEGVNYSLYDRGQGTHSTVTFDCESTIITQGQVKIIDPSGTVNVASFTINTFIDSNYNGINDEFEERLYDLHENLTSYSDFDQDSLSDLYELAISNTSWQEADTDRDGLYDGIDPSTGIGEIVIGTNPLDDDSDDDLLSDRFEFFGWNISTELGNIHVSSCPTDLDSDNDFLDDYAEYMAGTHPRDPDSDNDKLLDGLDPFPLKKDGDEDGLTDFEEIQLGTNINQSDTDQDGITDGLEVHGWHFQTSPISADSDHDFLADSAEYKIYTEKTKWYQNGTYIGEDRARINQDIYIMFDETFESAAFAQLSLTISYGEYGTDGNNEYGIENVPDLFINITKDGLTLFNFTTNRTRHISQVINIKETIERDNKTDYYGKYFIHINNTQVDCILEEYKLEVAKYLDPNKEDYDGDSLMDGIESNLLVEGTDIIDFREFYELDNLTIYPEPNTHDEYYLEIPDIGRVNDATLSLNITSNEMLGGNGNISIIIIKKDINCSIADAVLVSAYFTFTIGAQFNYATILPLKDYIQNQNIIQYYGDYQLKISVLESNFIDNFTLNEFFIETETWIPAGPADSHAWITDPAKFDSDGDTLSDAYEILRGYNPLSADTDADGFLDYEDIDPLHDLIMEIKFVAASGGLGLIHPWYKASASYVYQGKNVLLWTPEVGSSMGLNYYTNIDDNTQSIPFNFELWAIGISFIIEILKIPVIGNLIGFFTNLFGIELQKKTITVKIPDYRLGKWEGYQFTPGNDIAHTLRNGAIAMTVNINTIRLERLNTIAVYNSNATHPFNGHYETQERMNILHLEIIDDATGTPFQKGWNALVIPTSIFTQTILNGKIQKSQLGLTPLANCEFAGVERDEGDVQDEAITASEHVDFLLIQEGLTSSEAMEVLEMLLIVVSNESTNETTRLHAYMSTKLNQIIPERMNLHHDVLTLIPIVCPYESSDTSDPPMDFWEAVLFNFKEWIDFGLSFLIAFADTAKNIGNILGPLIQSVGLMIIQGIGNLGWIIVRTALFILFYILLALEVFTIVPIFFVGGAIAQGLGLMGGLKTKWGVNIIVPYGINTKIGYLDFELYESQILIEATVVWHYWDYFDLYIPLLDFNFDVKTDVLDTTPEPNPEYDKPSAPKLHCGFDQIGNTSTYDFHTIYEHIWNKPPDFVNLTLLSPTENLYSYEMNVSYNAEYSNRWIDRLFTIKYWSDKGYTYNASLNSFSPEDLWYKCVRFNITIDFEKEFPSEERAGQWKYRFSTNATSWGLVINWPIIGFATGPFFNYTAEPADPFDYLMFSSVDTEIWIIDEEFMFSVTGADYFDNMLPVNVSLMLQWENGSTHKIIMEEFDVYHLPTNISMTTFDTNVNFSNYLPNIREETWISYYFQADFQDGKTSVLMDYAEQNDTIIYHLFNLKISPKNQPGDPPIIKAWYIEDIHGNEIYDYYSKDIHWIGGDFLPALPNFITLSDDNLLKFWVYIENHDENLAPELILTNFEQPNNPLEPIELIYTGNGHGPAESNENWKEYSVIVRGDGLCTYQNSNMKLTMDFKPGAWRASFRVNNQSMESRVKIWRIGSTSNMINTMLYGVPQAGETTVAIGKLLGWIPLIGPGLIWVGENAQTAAGGIWTTIFSAGGYMIASIMSRFEALQIASQGVAGFITILNLVNNFFAWGIKTFNSDDTGSLLGLGAGLLLKAVGFAIVLKLSKAGRGLFNLKFLRNAAGFAFLIQAWMILSALMTSPQLVYLQDIGVVPVFEFDLNELYAGAITFFSSMLALSTMLTITTGAAGLLRGFLDSDSNPIANVIKIDSLFTLAIAVLSIFAFFHKTGFIYLF
jgi:hypothetical protein